MASTALGLAVMGTNLFAGTASGVFLSTDGGMLSSGIYFHCIRAGDFTETRKVVLMR
jgi:hypothetical protein